MKITIKDKEVKDNFNQSQCNMYAHSHLYFDHVIKEWKENTQTVNNSLLTSLLFAHDKDCCIKEVQFQKLHPGNTYI
jgi:hypothetical protein